MLKAVVKKYAGPFSPCCVCKTSPAFAIYDREQEGFVCPECAKNLVLAQAWLRAIRCEGCTGRRNV